jgi:hypothetical protein
MNWRHGNAIRLLCWREPFSRTELQLQFRVWPGTVMLMVDDVVSPHWDAR